MEKSVKSGIDATQALVNGDKQSQTSITSGKTTALLGTQVYGNKVKIDTHDLTIRSLQETSTYKSKQQNLSGQVTVGYGASVSASYNQSKVNSDYASVIEQSGIYAGDGGYQVNVQNHTEMTGGIMTSTEKAEAENRNRIETGTLSARDVQNHANYSGSGFAISGSVAMNFDTPLGKYGQAQSNKQAVNEKGEKLYEGQDGKETTQATSGGKNNPIKLAEGLDSLTGNASFGFGSEKDSQRSETKSGINTANIVIKDEQGQLEKTGKSAEQVKSEIKTEVTTETAENHSGKLENRFDKDKVLKEIQLQVNTTKAFLDNADEAKDRVIDYFQKPYREKLREAIVEYQNAKKGSIEKAEKYAEIEKIISDIYTLEHVRSVLNASIIAMVGGVDLSILTEGMSAINIEARRETLRNSLLSPKIIDPTTNQEISNVSGYSGSFDGIKLGGVRLDLDVICGKGNERCKEDENGNFIFQATEKYSSLQKVLNDPQYYDKLYGLTGGQQGIKGTFFGIPYQPGSLVDKFVERYAGLHDLNGQFLFYDQLGNTARGKTEEEYKKANIVTAVAVGYVSPVVLFQALPATILKAISH